jgi:endonuclease I
MKQLKYYIGLFVLIAGAAAYVSETMLGIDLMELIFPETVTPIDDETPVVDEEAPLIDITGIRTTLSQNESYVLDDIPCTDNIDTECTVIVVGVLDTSVLGEQSVILRATDEAGNVAEETVVFEVIAGIDTTMYVPLGYYDDAIGLTGEALKNALNDIITNHTEFDYTHSTRTDVWDILRDVDEDPDNPENVLLFYSGFSWPKECQDTTTPPDYCYQEETQVEWNREHIWSKSHGEFEHEDGSSAYALGAHTDAHHLVPAERRMNSIKNNRYFDDCHDGIDDTNVEDRGYGNYTCGEWFFEPRDEVKGDVARMLFYMAVRYEGETGDYVDLELIADLKELVPDQHIQDNNLPYYGNLAVLLRWHIEDPVDEWELLRNEGIYQFQGNRNPFIDHPEWVTLIWGTPEEPIHYDSVTVS